MAAISQKIPNLVGGVSQQPDTIKYSNQLRSCDNYYPDVTLGLLKRPGLQAISKLNNVITDGTWFLLVRDDKEKYLVEVGENGTLRVWNALTGVQQTVNAVAAAATNYLKHNDPDDLETLQINDFTFILNRTVKAETKATLSASITPYAFVSINTVAYASTYSIILNGTTYSYASPTTSTTQLNIGDIVTSLTSTINASPTWVAQSVGNVIHIRAASNVDFTIEARGGNAGTSLDAFKGTVNSVAQLPRQFINGTKVKVANAELADEDDYWVQFETSDGSSKGVGTWVETIAPGVKTSLDEETLPHALIREANGTFTFRKLDLAGATASAGTVPVSGVPTAVSIVSATSGGHVVDELFTVKGGTGSGLKLRVSKVKTVTTTATFLATSTTNVRRVGWYGNLTYTWYENNKKIGTTKNKASLTIGNTTYTVNGNFAYYGSIYKAGVKKVTTVKGVIDQVKIKVPGQGYTAGNSVTNKAGDTFGITTVNTPPLKPDLTALQYWKPRTVGDDDTNPFPTFVDNTIDSISFFKNRLVLTSRQNVICSQVGDYFNFFASTAITIVDSDPIDISATSLKPVRFKHAASAPRGLLLFGDNAQYILETTTESFSSKTAELNLLGAYSQIDRVAPVDIGPSYVFLEEGAKATSVFEMNIGDNVGNKPVTSELTRIIPSYIPAAIRQFKGSSAAGLFGLLSEQNPKNLYLYRFFNLGEQRISSWFKWIMPGDIVTFDFDQDIMYVVLKLENSYVLTTVSLINETPNNSLVFEDEYLDVRLDCFDYNPVKVYDAVNDVTKICFDDGFEDTTLQPVLVYLKPEIAGNIEEQTLQIDLLAPVGQRYFLTVDGDQTADQFAIGYKYEATAELPAFYYIQEEGRKDTLNIPRVHRLAINSYNSGPYRVSVESEGRPEFSMILPQIAADYYLANNIPLIRNAQSSVPIFAKGTQVVVKLIADSPFPTSFTSINWEGTYSNKGIRPV